MEIELRTGLVGFFNSLVPAPLREKYATSSAEYVRIRALSVMLVVMLLLSVPGALSVVIRQLDAAPHFLLSDWSGVLVLLVYGAQVALFYKFNNYWLSALAFTSIYLLVLVIMVVMSGGHESPMKMLLLTCPFISFMISGKHEGIQTSMLVLVIGIVLAFLQSISFDAPDIFADANDYWIFSTDWIIAVTIIIFSLMVYESALRRSEEFPLKPKISRDGDFVMGIIDRFIHQLIPPLLRESLTINSATYIRARFLSVMLLAVTVLGSLTVFPMIAAFWWWDANPSSMLLQNLVSIAILFVFIFQAWLFYRFGNHAFSSLLFANSYFLVILVMVMASGGYNSPLKYFLLTCPLIAFVVGGAREGMQNAMFTMIAGLTLAGLKLRGFEMPDIFIHTSYPYLVFSTNWMVTIGVIMACIMVYETELQRQESV